MSDPLPMVRVLWNDAQEDAVSWCRIEDLSATPCVATTIGSLLPVVRPNHVSVALSHYPDDDTEPLVGGVLHIPRPMVLSIEYLTADPQ